jgi:hypothetical protein
MVFYQDADRDKTSSCVASDKYDKNINYNRQ